MRAVHPGFHLPKETMSSTKRASLSTALACAGLIFLGCDGGPSTPCFPGPAVQGLGRADEEVNARSLQGLTRPDEEVNGTSAQGKDLNGARFTVADGKVAVSLAKGTLFADGAAFRGAALTATTQAGARRAVEVLEVASTDGIERVGISVGGVGACSPGDEGLFVEGFWDSRGQHHDVPGTLTYSCSSGVIAKCVKWGYAPWAVGAEVHAACTRMARADYCGDGSSWTIEGTVIGIKDTFGVHDFEPHDAFSFEAAWGPEGARCVNETRYTVTGADGAPVRPSCLSALPRCAPNDNAPLSSYSERASLKACE